MTTYRGYIIKPHKTFPRNYIVATEGQGGKIPNILSGIFTSTGFVQQIIDAYLDKPKIKRKYNASKTRTTSGD